MMMRSRAQLSPMRFCSSLDGKMGKNMKRLLALMLALLLLCSCGNGITKEYPARIAAGKSNVSSLGESRLALKRFLEGSSLVDGNDNLWLVPNETVARGRYQELQLFGDNLLLGWSGFDTYHLQLVDIYTGELLCEAVQTGVQSPSLFPGDDWIGLVDAYGKTVTIYDDRLQKLNSYEFDINNDLWLLSPDCRTLYSPMWTGGLIKIDMENNERQTLMENGTEFYSVGQPDARRSSTLILHYTDRSTGLYEYIAFNTADGSLTPCPFTDGSEVLAFDGTNWLVRPRTADYVYLYGESPLSASVIQPDSWYFSLDPLSGCFLQTDNVYNDEDGSGKTIFKAYHRDGTFVSCCSLNDRDAYLNGAPLWSEVLSGWLMIVTDSTTGDSSLLFWSPEDSVREPDLTLQDYSDFLPVPGSGQAVAASLYERAAELSARSGLVINIADQCATVYDEYATDQVLDYWLIDDALDELEAAINSFPEGIFYQLTYEDIRTLEVNLTGSLYPLSLPEDGNGYSSFAAFVQTGYGKNILVLDITLWGLYGSLCHEFGHMIDRKVVADSWLRDDALFSEYDWSLLNPDDFCYAYSYYYIGDEICRERYYDYFIDDYSRTWPTEDRARIIEYAMNGNDFYYEGADGLLMKLAYYSACIRDALDTTNWPDIVSWEQPLYKYGWLSEEAAG